RDGVAPAAGEVVVRERVAGDVVVMAIRSPADRHGRVSARRGPCGHRPERRAGVRGQRGEARPSDRRRVDLALPEGEGRELLLLTGREVAEPWVDRVVHLVAGARLGEEEALAVGAEVAVRAGDEGPLPELAVHDLHAGEAAEREPAIVELADTVTVEA